MLLVKGFSKAHVALCAYPKWNEIKGGSQNGYKLWDIQEEETQAWLDAIARERSYAESGSSEHVRPDDELPVNLSGLETLNMTWDLFETAAQMDDLSDRQEMLNFAKWMEESQNLLDWIKLTQAERKAWKEGSASA